MTAADNSRRIAGGEMLLSQAAGCSAAEATVVVINEIMTL